MNLKILSIAAPPSLIIALFAFPAFGHHSITMYDRTVETSITGTVTEWEWTNPHCWLHVLVEDENGTARLWTLEANSTGQMARVVGPPTR